MRRLAFSALVVATLIAGCGGGDDDATTATAPARASAITITDFKFTPAAITVASGAKVTLTNHGGQAHTVTADDGHSFDSGDVAAGASASIVAPPAGTYPYHCTIHPFMKGSLTVS